MKKCIALFTAVALFTGCAWLKSEGTVAETTAVSCAKADVADLASTVAGILSASGGWEAALDALAIKVGKDAVACTVQVVIAVAKASTGSAASTGLLIPTPGVAAGNAWIVKQNIVLK